MVALCVDLGGGGAQELLEPTTMLPLLLELAAEVFHALHQDRPGDLRMVRWGRRICRMWSWVGGDEREEGVNGWEMELHYMDTNENNYTMP